MTLDLDVNKANLDWEQNKMTTTNKKESPKSITKSSSLSQVESKYSPVSTVSQTIVNLQIKYDQLRSSTVLKQLISEIFQLNAEVIKTDSIETSVRHNLISDLLVHELCIPHLLSLIGVGVTIGFLSENDKIQARVKNILVKAFNLLKHSDDHHAKNESDSDLDFDRLLLFVDLIKYNSTPLLPHSITVTNNAPFVLKQLSCHILGVASVSPVLSQAVSQVVSHLSVTLSNKGHSWTIDEKAPQVKSTIIEFFTWLRANSVELVRLSGEEAVLQSVDPSVRAWLKHEHYSSPIELISVYQQKYRSVLSNINIPLASAFATDDVHQAVRDLSTSRLTVNGAALSSVNLAELDTPSEVFTPLTDSSSTSNATDSQYRPNLASIDTAPTASETIKASLRRALVEISANPETLSTVLLTATATEGIVWQQDLLDMLLSQTMLATSPVFSGGSAFLILSDLFGGDGLVFCPVGLSTESVSLKTLSASPRSPRSPTTRKKSISDSSDLTVIDGEQNLVIDAAAPKYADVSIVISDFRIRVTLKERYGLYLQHGGAHCDGNHSKIKALCNFECSTTTNISLRPEGGAKNDLCFSLYSALLGNPEKVCRRTVSIVPYLPEVVV